MRLPLLLLPFVAVLLASPAWAQLQVSPQSLSVVVPQHETVERTVTLTNARTEPLAFCLSFERPLQRSNEDGRSGLRLSAEAAAVSGAACGDYGEVLDLIGADEVETPVTWSPYGLTMLPDGRLFAADFTSNQTHELTPELEHVRSFAHPVVAEFEPFPVTTGLTYNADTQTLWWLNVESSGFDFYRALLLEGDLNGEPTGRRIELPIGAPDVPPDERIRSVGLSYDPSQGRYYYTGVESETIWAVDTLGHVAPGYPVQPEAYPGATLFWGLNALLGEDDAEALRFELYLNPPGSPPPRLGVVGRYGGDTAQEAEPLETPLLDPLPGTDGSGNINGEPVRSVLDPNGVLYYPWSGFDGSGVVAIRPHPLPPSWLSVSAWDGELGPGESTEVTLTFAPGGRSVGAYTSSLQAFEAASGEAVEVPLALTVTEGVEAEDEAESLREARLSVYPNPSVGDASVAFVLPAPDEASVAVFDVLGREVAVLHDGPLGAGEHTFTLPARSLPAGVYLVRATAAGRAVTRRLVLAR